MLWYFSIFLRLAATKFSDCSLGQVTSTRYMLVHGICDSHPSRYMYCPMASTVELATAVFLSEFGPRGGKTSICNLVGGHGSLNMQICQFQGGARVSLGGANAPPRPPLKETLCNSSVQNILKVPRLQHTKVGYMGKKKSNHLSRWPHSRSSLQKMPLDDTCTIACIHVLYTYTYQFEVWS